MRIGALYHLKFDVVAFSEVILGDDGGGVAVIQGHSTVHHIGKDGWKECRGDDDGENGKTHIRLFGGVCELCEGKLSLSP